VVLVQEHDAERYLADPLAGDAELLGDGLYGRACIEAREDRGVARG
jgi:hypothetical protein